MKKYIIVSICCLIFIGCSTPALKKKRLANFTIVSTRNIDYSSLKNISKKLKARGVQAIQWGEIKEDSPELEGSIQQVIEDAVIKAGGDFMVNCVLYYVTQGKKTGFMVQGDVIETLEDQYGN